MKKISCFLLLFANAYAQAGICTIAPHASVKSNVSSFTMVFLSPRVALTRINDDMTIKDASVYIESTTSDNYEMSFENKNSNN